MPRLKKISGPDCVKLLCKHFGFHVTRQKGSHIVLRKETADGRISTVIPNHKELKIPTLKCVLKLAKIGEEEFAKHQ